MQLVVDQSLAAGFIPINTWQHRASLPFKPGVLERKVYNNDDITFFSILMFAKPSCDNYHYHTWSWQMLIQGKNALSSY